jgi:hypothetical protein
MVLSGLPKIISDVMRSVAGQSTLYQPACYKIGGGLLPEGKPLLRGLGNNPERSGLVQSALSCVFR